MKIRFKPHASEDDRESAGSVRIEDIVASLGISAGYGFEVFRQVYGISLFSRQFKR
ncbi:hypothetical protein GE107_14210 [Cohnella sp. CFH 77786]|uniref:hypothetical protein n=1 Tax=Cohnella sp. CFH 77786 TaxID=2662265 RepID=UPI001C60CEB8|nr:hypothetical protein [Cohnella sp. CFH 77786]MBW5447207.1 hypothetical protein [Cohnella sp. CFH 77786]